MVEINKLVLRMIIEERNYQDKKWGANRELPNLAWLAILMEEVGEAAEAILEQDDTLELEVVQVAAVAVAWLEALERKALENKEEESR